MGSIDKHVDFGASTDYRVVSEKDSINKRYKNFVKEQDFDVLLRLIIRNMLIFGSAFLEVVWTGKNVKQLKLLDSKSMYVKRNDKGKVLSYSQWFGGQSKPTKFNADQIIHFAYNNLGGNPYGTSVMRSLFGDGEVSIAKQFLKLQQSMMWLLTKQINAKTHIKVGNDLNHPTQADIDSLATKLENSKNHTEWITSYLVNMEILGYEGKVMDIKPFINHYEDQIVYGLQTPYVLLGKGNMAEGLANTQMEAFERRVKSIQLAVSRSLENKLFDKMFGSDNYIFVWNANEQKELKELDTLIRFLAEKFILTPESRNIIENRIRKLLGSDEIAFKAYLKAFEDEQERKAKEAKRFGTSQGR